jgi:hypothetical protein
VLRERKRERKRKRGKERERAIQNRYMPFAAKCRVSSCYGRWYIYVPPRFKAFILYLPSPGKLARRRLFTPSLVFLVHPEFIRFGRELGCVPEQTFLSASLQLLVTREIF